MWAQLTNELLPTDILDKVLGEAQRDSNLRLPLVWYYQYSRAKPLWSENNAQIFEVSIPLVQPAQLILYNVLCWPTPVSATTGAKLMVEGRYSYDTVSGSLFRPEKCTGADMLVYEASIAHTGKDMQWSADRTQRPDGLLQDSNHPLEQDDCGPRRPRRLCGRFMGWTMHPAVPAGRHHHHADWTRMQPVRPKLVLSGY